MELTTLLFPFYQIRKHDRASQETARVLAEFDQKYFNQDDNSTLGDSTLASTITHSTGSKRGKMYTMESLDQCLNGSFDGLQVYASCMELNGENIIFLTKVLSFNKEWYVKFSKTTQFMHTRMTMFRAALGIYISLIDSHTAAYPINIESTVYQSLESVFGAATSLVACRRSSTSTTATPASQVTPWDEPADPLANALYASRESVTTDGFQMQTLQSTPPSRISKSESREQILAMNDRLDAHDPLVIADFKVPTAFDEHVFEPAFRSVRYMVWSETWQRYQAWKRTSGVAA